MLSKKEKGTIGGELTGSPFGHLSLNNNTAGRFLTGSIIEKEKKAGLLQVPDFDSRPKTGQIVWKSPRFNRSGKAQQQTNQNVEVHGKEGMDSTMPCETADPQKGKTIQGKRQLTNSQTP